VPETRTNSATSRKLKTPFIDPELIKYLETVFPDVMPSYQTSNEEKCFKAGQIEVVKRLKAIAKSQSDNLLEVK